jgi:hypothetical protein
MQDGFLLATKEIHPSFESLEVFSTLGLHAFVMKVHHDTI